MESRDRGRPHRPEITNRETRIESPHPDDLSDPSSWTSSLLIATAALALALMVSWAHVAAADDAHWVAFGADLESAASRELDAVVEKRERDELDQIEKHIREHKVPDVILDRHAEMVRAYQRHTAARRRSNSHDLSETAETQGQRQSSSGLDADSSTSQERRTANPLWPRQLPFRVAAPDRNGSVALAPDEHVVHRDAQPTSTTVALAAADDAAHLAETTEIVLSQSIREKAAALEHSPVKILSWVRNQVEWVPTWGSNQNAEHTLWSRRGNAFAVTSLAIALLRASGVPARYVHGRIELPADKFNSAIGSHLSVEAAWDAASAAGLPVVAIRSKGRIVAFEFQHIWIEAAVDYLPSRGAGHVESDSWVPFDPSIKTSHHFEQPDILALSAVDPLSVFTRYAASGTLDRQSGAVYGLNSALITGGLAMSQDRAPSVTAAVRSAFETNFDPLDVASFADVASGTQVHEMETSVLPRTLPYARAIAATRYASLPPEVQAKVVLSLGVDIGGDPVEPAEFPLSDLNNGKIEIGFTFASDADHDTFDSFLPVKPTEIEALAGAIPAYLIRLVPEMRVEGQVIRRGTPMRFGDVLEAVVEIRRVGSGAQMTRLPIPVGSHVALGIISESIRLDRFHDVRTRVDVATRLLETATPDSIAQSAPDFYSRLTSDLYYLGLLDYYSRQILVGDLIGRGARAGRIDLIEGVGLFGYVPHVTFRFGLPHLLKTGVLQMDVRHLLFNVVAADNNAAGRKLLAQQIASAGSSLEGDVPSNLFGGDAQPLAGYSAINNISRAASIGQKVYHIDSTNKGVLAQIRLPARVAEDISNAVDAGLEAITHETLLPVPGHTAGVTTLGYIIQDPTTGAGAYLLDSGTNGGVANLTNDIMKDCAYLNRPGFVDNDLDWARSRIVLKCAEYTKGFKEEQEHTQNKLINAKLEAVKNFHEIYAKVPMVIVDCMVAGGPEELSAALVLIRTAAAMLAVQAAQVQSLLIAEWLKPVSKDLLGFVKLTHDACMGGDFDLVTFVKKSSTLQRMCEALLSDFGKCGRPKLPPYVK